MSKILAVFAVQLLAFMLVYPLWVRRTSRISFGRWLMIALVALISSSVFLLFACYVGHFCL